MERRKKAIWINIYLWAFILIQFPTLMAATNETVFTQQTNEDPTSYAWSSWGSWSACSRTCGGGVAVQERQCLPRPRNLVTNDTLAAPTITVRVTRQADAEECSGVAKRYHECNTAPCPGGVRDMREEQCASYDRRPFRGRFYAWVPYIDGDSPCTLNCRPLGQHFYASLALVADGTPCTRSGFRAICVQGECKVVGRDTVLAAVGGTREVHCGRRLVSGLFSRPRLPLGYSYVTTVPRGACRLNVSEIIPSENFIALKISNGSYIMNGEFAVSAPGTYETAGARFLYTRVASRDSVFAVGPIHHPIDIMILYTQPNPSIKYEYFTESIPGEVDIESATRLNVPDVFPTASTKHSRRHHSFDTHPKPTVSAPRHPDLVSMSKEISSSEEDDIQENIVGTRRFLWKITSYTQCSRSCGGGIQVGKYRCVEISASGPDREISPIHCSGSPPAGKRRRCANLPCPPRWRAAAWSPCPKCGPATRTRIVGCVQDHSRGITKISDQKCPAPKSATTEICDIPDCGDINTGKVKHIETKRIKPPRQDTDTFREGPIYTVSVNGSDTDIGPEYSFSATAGWLFTEWSECVGWCVGGGVQTRAIRCADPSGCSPHKSPESTRTCNVKFSCDPHDGHWFTGDWSQCSSHCGGKQVRGVLCIGGSGRHLRESACKSPRPDHERDCGDECPPTWYISDWGQCLGNCTSGVGVQRRTVWCARGAGGADGADAEGRCSEPRPLAQRVCTLRACATIPSTLPPDLTIESQKAFGSDSVGTPEVTTKESASRDCEDQLNNCYLAVQARLCHYNYYVQNCCNSCRGR